MMLFKFHLLFVSLQLFSSWEAVQSQRCGTRPRSSEEKENGEALAQEKLREIGGESALSRQQILIDTYWHVIHDGSDGDLTASQIEESIRVLNQDFADSGSNFQYNLIGTTYTNNRRWFDTWDDDDYFDMSQALHEGDCSTANIYSTGMTEALGFVYYNPHETRDSCQGSYIDDGIWIRHNTIPGGSDEDYNLGKTLTHEVGHWMGLHHTFEDGCSGRGDLVDDTPPEAEPNYGCPSTVPDTCPGGGPDPINNYMDYSYDSCLTEFTPGQVERMLTHFNLFRADGRGCSGIGCFDDATDDVYCFSPHATAVVKDKGTVTMRDLAVGDHVLTASGEYQTVYTINHFHHTKPTTFLQIHTDLVDDEIENALELSGMHMVYIEGKEDPVPALEVQVGDYLQSLNYGPRKVTDIKLVTRNGLYNPIAADGTMVVDGIIASSYTSFTGSAFLEIAGTKLVSVHNLLEMTIAPYRQFCMATSFLNICNQHGEDELPVVVQLLKKLYGFFSKQSDTVQFVIITLYLSLFRLINLLVSKLGAFAVVAVAGCILFYRGNFRKRTSQDVLQTTNKCI